MSKTEDMRALREALREERQGKPVKRVAKPVGPALCGHRSVGGKACTRPVDHPEKSHRYAG